MKFIKNEYEIGRNKTTVISSEQIDIISVLNSSSRLARFLMFVGMHDYDNNALYGAFTGDRDESLHLTTPDTRDGSYYVTVSDKRLLRTANQLSKFALAQGTLVDSYSPQSALRAQERASEINGYFTELAAFRALSDEDRIEARLFAEEVNALPYDQEVTLT